LISNVLFPRRRRADADRCTFPACGHVRTYFAAPRHVTVPRCPGVTWWFGCAAWWSGHCTCPGCAVTAQPGGLGADTACRCPDLPLL
jgi:hypothetical protein